MKLLDSLYTPFFPVTQPAAATGSPNEPKALPPYLDSNDPSRPLNMNTVLGNNFGYDTFCL